MENTWEDEENLTQHASKILFDYKKAHKIPPFNISITFHMTLPQQSWAMHLIILILTWPFFCHLILFFPIALFQSTTTHQPLHSRQHQLQWLTHLDKKHSPILNQCLSLLPLCKLLHHTNDLHILLTHGPKIELNHLLSVTKNGLISRT